jgi:cytochrome P450
VQTRPQTRQQTRARMGEDLPVANRRDTVGRTAVRWGLGHALPQGVIRSAGRKGDLHGRLFIASSGDDHDALLSAVDELRAAGPLHRGRYAFATVSHPVVREVLSSNDFRAGFEASGDGALARLSRWGDETAPLGPLRPPSLLVTEPPDHTRYRKLVNRVFTVRAVAELRGRTEEIADQLLDQMVGQDPVDLVERYCSLLPVTVIAEILGVPQSEREKVLEYGAAAAPSLDLGLSWRRFRTVEAALREFDQWLERHVERVRDEPGDDLLGRLVTARGADGRGLDDAELKSTAGLVLAAGFETTVNLLGNGIALLVEHPDQLDRLRARPELWPNAVDEVLRVDPPVLLTGRMCVRETEIAGVRVPAGGVVTTVLAGANRDPDVFSEPDRFDVARPNADQHVAFSAGRHYCLGAALARMEGEVGLRRLFDRFPDMALKPGANRRPTRILRGYEKLPASLGSDRG